MRRSAAGLALAGALGASMLAVAAPPVAKGASDETLVVATYYSDPAYEKAFAAVVDTFRVRHPEIRVTVNTVDGGKYAALLKTWLPTDDPPDVVGWHPSQKLWTHAAQGLVEPIDDVFDGGFEAAFPERMKSLCSYRGKVLLVPQSWYWWAVYFNKEVFARRHLKPPSTWKELLEVCARLKADGVTPIALGTKEPWVLAGWFDHVATAAHGGAFRDGLMAGAIAYTDPRVKKTLQYMTELVQKGYVSKGFASLGPWEAAEQMAKGEAGMFLVGQSLITGLPADRQAQLDFFAFPRIDGEESYVEMPIDGYMMPSHARHKAAARKFLAFLAAEPQQEAFCRPLGLMAAHKLVRPQGAAMVKGLKTIETAAGWMQHYDRDTPEAMALKGMDGFIQAVEHPERVDEILAGLEQERRRVFGKELLGQ